MVLGAIVHDFVLNQVVRPLEQVRRQQRVCRHRQEEPPIRAVPAPVGAAAPPALYSPNRQPEAHTSTPNQHRGRDRETLFEAQKTPACRQATDHAVY